MSTTKKFKKNTEWKYKMIKKESAGIALCRFNYKKNKHEILLVKKRCTYWYVSFILGLYKDKRGDQLRKYLLYLFSRMTVEEKMAIYSLDYEIMWNHCYPVSWNPYQKKRHIHNYETYKEKKFIFDNLISDHGRKLQHILNISKNSSLMWEIPKGRKALPEENTIECAVREFEEETNIKKDQYKIVSTIKPLIFTHRDENVCYINTYYVAVPTASIRVKINFDIETQVREIIDIRWLSEYDCNLLNCAQPGFIRQIFSKVCKKICFPTPYVPDSNTDQDQSDNPLPISDLDLGIPDTVDISELSNNYYEDTLPTLMSNDTNNE